MNTRHTPIAAPPTIPPIVLIVDDVEETGLMYECMLSAGHMYVSRSSIGEAFDYARELRPELIVADIDLRPGHERGIEFLDRVAADSELREVPVIVVTGTAPSPGTALGTHHVLLKPAAPEALLACVEALCKSREVRRRSETLRQSVAAVMSRAQRALARSAQVREVRAAAPADSAAKLPKGAPAD
jgi:CheY-like chemotaxis protein